MKEGEGEGVGVGEHSDAESEAGEMVRHHGFHAGRAAPFLFTQKGK